MIAEAVTLEENNSVIDRQAPADKEGVDGSRMGHSWRAVAAKSRAHY